MDFAFPSGATMAGGSYALVVGIPKDTFRAKYSIPAAVQIFDFDAGGLPLLEQRGGNGRAQQAR